MQWTPRRRVMAFLAVTAAASLPLQVLEIVGVPANPRWRRRLVEYPLLWAPAMGALGTALAARRGIGRFGWKSSLPRYLALAAVAPPLYAAAIYIPTWISGLGAFDTSAIGGADGLPAFVRDRLATFPAALFGALGEEIGWRGFLVPELAEGLSFSEVSILSGTIWGAWHLPQIVFGSFHNGVSRLTSAACFMLSGIGLSFLLAWLRLRSGSLWPAVVLHASHNIFMMLVLPPLTRNTRHTANVAGEFGLGLVCVGAVIALLCLRHPPTTWADD